MYIFINLLLTVIFLLHLYYFEKVEPLFFNSLWGKTIFIVYGALLLLALVTSLVVKNRQSKKRKGLFNNAYLNWGLTIGILLVVFLSIVINLNRNFLDWDTLALYDARAKFLGHGVNFSQMANFSKYDNLNKYYYSLYPPFTSVVHFFMHKNTPFINTGLFYSMNLFLLATVVYIFGRNYVGKSLALLGAFFSVAYKDIFLLSIMQYTNLPFTLFLIIGIFSIFKYLDGEEKRFLYWGSLFTAMSVWIRFLEPIWIAVSVSFLISSILKKEILRSILDFLVLFIPSLIAFSSWSFFSSVIAQAPSAVSFNFQSIVEPLVGIFTGSLVSIARYFVLWFAVPLMISSISLVYVKKDKPALLFLGTSIVLTILIYFSGLYFVSFQSPWWSALGNSLGRSSVFIIPIVVFLIVNRLSEFLVSTKNSKIKKSLKK